MGLGAGELVLILVIAYVVVGPEDMVKLARTLAKTLRQFRKMSADLREEAVGGLKLPSMPEADIDLNKSVRNNINNAAGSVSSDLDSVLTEIKKAEAQLENKKS